MSLLIENITKSFGNNIAIKNLSLEIAKNQIYGFLGANGAGKTTMFRLILGILAPTKGSITWNGERIDYTNSDLVGYLPEERGLYAELPVRQQLIYFAELRGMNKTAANSQIDYWLERFHISDYSNRRLQELSKGNQQKIQFISAVQHSPELLLLDEPFSGLDPVNVELLKDAVKYLAEEGTTILFSSHRLDHVEELCENLCLLDNGEAILEGNLKQIKRESASKNIHIKTEINLDFLNDMAEVTGIIKKADRFIVKLQNEAFSQKILQELVARGEITLFSLEEPSLNDIFIEKVGVQYE